MFYVRNHRVGSIEYIGHELLVEVKTKTLGGGNIRITQNNCDGWIFEADDYFQLYCMMKYGFSPAYVSDDEYNRLKEDSIVFLSKARTKEFKKAVLTMLPNK